MEWDNKLPKAPGWYWLKRRTENSQVVYVRNYGGELAIGNSTLKGWKSMEEALWAGPISPPAENSLDIKYSKSIKKCSSRDKEADHDLADFLLCELLERLGYKKTVKAFKKLEKFYA